MQGCLKGVSVLTHTKNIKRRGGATTVPYKIQRGKGKRISRNQGKGLEWSQLFLPACFVPLCLLFFGLFPCSRSSPSVLELSEGVVWWNRLEGYFCWVIWKYRNEASGERCSESHRMVLVGRGLKDQLIPTPHFSHWMIKSRPAHVSFYLTSLYLTYPVQKHRNGAQMHLVQEACGETLTEEVWGGERLKSCLNQRFCLIM